MRLVPSFAIALAGIAAAVCTSASAWGPDGHHTVGALADKLIAGKPAAAQVQALLGGLRLQNASVWADCARGVDPAQGYAYTTRGRYPECRIFETPELEAEMSDFVRRNDVNCDRRPSEESCHKQYHYTDVAIQRDHYAPGLVGTRDDDIVAAIGAATRVLQGEAAPAPFDIKSQREALLLLAHYVGDIHQPLHVGAIYLDARGRRVDPDTGTFDPATDTRGGNQIITARAASGQRGAKLHAVWDAVPPAQTASHIDAAWLQQARALPPSAGDVAGWPAAWASRTLGQARSAYAGLTFGPEKDGFWTASLQPSYERKAAAIKKTQLTEGGARLAQLLEAIWP